MQGRQGDISKKTTKHCLRQHHPLIPNISNGYHPSELFPVSVYIVFHPRLHRTPISSELATVHLEENVDSNCNSKYLGFKFSFFYMGNLMAEF